MDSLNNNFSMMTVEEMNLVDGGTWEDIFVFTITGVGVGAATGAAVGGLGAIPGMGLGAAVGFVEGVIYSIFH